MTGKIAVELVETFSLGFLNLWTLVSPSDWTVTVDIDTILYVESGVGRLVTWSPRLGKMPFRRNCDETAHTRPTLPHQPSLSTYKLELQTNHRRSLQNHGEGPYEGLLLVENAY